MIAKKKHHGLFLYATARIWYTMYIHFKEKTMMTITRKRSLGMRIKKLRKDKKMTQTDLAEAVGYSGKSSVARVESGDNYPGPEKLEKIASALGTTPEYLTGERTDNLYFAKIKPGAIIPTKKDEDAGYDIYALIDEPIVIHSGETKLIPTGIASAMSDEYYLQVEERSSIGSRGIKKSAGIIDSGYRGEIKIALTNTTDNTVIVANNSHDFRTAVLDHINETSDSWTALYTEKAIAQLIVHRVYKMDVHEIAYEELQKIPSVRGTGGFGSTGK